MYNLSKKIKSIVHSTFRPVNPFQRAHFFTYVAGAIHSPMHLYVQAYAYVCGNHVQKTRTFKKKTKTFLKKTATF